MDEEEQRSLKFNSVQITASKSQVNSSPIEAIIVIDKTLN